MAAPRGRCASAGPAGHSTAAISTCELVQLFSLQEGSLSAAALHAHQQGRPGLCSEGTLNNFQSLTSHHIRLLRREKEAKRRGFLERRPPRTRQDRVLAGVDSDQKALIFTQGHGEASIHSPVCPFTPQACSLPGIGPGCPALEDPHSAGCRHLGSGLADAAPGWTRVRDRGMQRSTVSAARAGRHQSDPLASE